MSDMLSQIVNDKRLEVETTRRSRPLEDVKAAAQDAAPPRNFFAAVTRPKGKLRVIAEVKKASPSAGVIREDFDPVAIARAYHENGAAALSCLTDEKYFQGKLEYIQQIKKVVPLPVLRKDFIVDPYQIYEARAAGADAILLIAECLGEAQMIDLLILATELKLTALVEVHDYESLIQVQSHVGFPHPGYQLLGINNRNLKTMTTDIGHTMELLKEVPNTDILVSESGIRTNEDIQRLAEAGVHRVLVGEHLMRQPDVGEALRELIGESA
ncbi:indole-3-glycerol phosphate synthase TrpC [Algisphaera agarilytica]|uniref:Indole-3-glycerol phosphate synthase n=1 Tax=Algisphaera agarilytica TaxID=1385975 RepID=A0A7X0H5K9_9BACT|nr:indole-3-glycerol phosphate synthase TrpC [Algisphaera agarilytica]MBB6428229.1 indole-3-glycerol phosphate synthase [Algisphaera agarilytica]